MRSAAESALPIILLTARDAEVDTVIGLEAGADDYVTKPFSVAELMSRVAALLRRRRIDAADRSSVRLSVAGLDIDPLGRTVESDGKEIRLTSAEFELLLLLAEAPGQVFTRSTIMEHLWRTPFFGDERAADTHIANIRRKLERDPVRPTRILTVRGVGYKLGAAPRRGHPRRLSAHLHTPPTTPTYGTTWVTCSIDSSVHASQRPKPGRRGHSTMTILSDESPGRLERLRRALDEPRSLAPSSRQDRRHAWTSRTSGPSTRS